MPFGSECQFEDFEDCISTIMQRDSVSREEAEAICGAIQAETKDQCTERTKNEQNEPKKEQ